MIRESVRRSRATASLPRSRPIMNSCLSNSARFSSKMLIRVGYRIRDAGVEAESSHASCPKCASGLDVPTHGDVRFVGGPHEYWSEIELFDEFGVFVEFGHRVFLGLFLFDEIVLKSGCGA